MMPNVAKQSFLMELITNSPNNCVECDTPNWIPKQAKRYQMLELLQKTIRHHYWYVKYEPEDKRAALLTIHFATCGGDNTCKLITHYGDKLEKAIRDELEKETVS